MNKYRRYAIISEADLSVGVAMFAALHTGDRDTPKTILPFKAPAALDPQGGSESTGTDQHLAISGPWRALHAP